MALARTLLTSGQSDQTGASPLHRRAKFSLQVGVWRRAFDLVSKSLLFAGQVRSGTRMCGWRPGVGRGFPDTLMLKKKCVCVCVFACTHTHTHTHTHEGGLLCVLSADFLAGNFVQIIRAGRNVCTDSRLDIRKSCALSSSALLETCVF